MIEAIGDSGGVALAARDFRDARRQRRAPSRTRASGHAAERIEIDDALAATVLDDAGRGTGAGTGARAAEPAAGTATVTAIAVARRLVAGAERALAAQARLGPAAVCRLVRSAMKDA